MTTIENSTFTQLTVDNTAPRVTFNTPADWANLSNGTQVFNVSIIETGMGIESVNFNVINGTAQVLYNASNETGGDWNASIDIRDLIEGVHTVMVLANDTISNLNNSELRNFTVDRTMPGIQIETINVSNFSTATANISFNVTDNLFSAVSCTAYVDGSANSVNSSTDAASLL